MINDDGIFDEIYSSMDELNKMSDVEKASFDEFKEKIEEAKVKFGVENEKDLKEKLPAQNTKSHGKMELVKLNGLALTENGALTRTKFFEDLEQNRHHYNDIVLTEEEARRLQMSYRHLSTGVNSVVPILCNGSMCPFKDTCEYYLMDKEPVGRPCPVEGDLLIYHTRKFFEEFDIKIEHHSEVMMAQELAELIIYEMRITRTLAQKGDSQALKGHRTKFAPDGSAVEEETWHWAWELKERIKNRRMKILDAFNATRKAKAATEKKQSSAPVTYLDSIKQMKEMLMNAQSADYTEIKEDE